MTPPRLVRGRYELIAPVGSGAQGEVHRARDTRHDRAVALKTRPDDPGILAEARVLYDVHPHPSLPLLREDFTEDGRLHLVLDWIDGVDLAARVRADGPFDLETVCELLAPVADALDHLHAHGPPVVHGDVKPANIVATPSGRVVLVDLGLARSSGGGTPGYRAPEAAAGAPCPASDVYGLAATAYALLTGMPPIAGAFARLATVAEHQSARVRRVLEWGLQLDPSRRPQRAGTFVDALAGVIATTNLPEPLTSFIGRGDDVRALDELVRSCRLVTVVGAGGSGKTRLATETARQLAAVTGGVVFVDLAPARAGVVHLLLRLLDQPAAGPAPLDDLTRLLARESRLVLFDNAEHLLDEVADVGTALLERCPGVRILLTSREPLGMAAETLLRIGGLGETSATELLLDRVRAADPRAELRAPDTDAAREVALAVDGLPLALELAGARAARDGLVSVADTVRERLGTLGPRRGGAPHHRTLAAVVDHSYDRLDEVTARALRVASVLIGGIDADVLATIAASPPTSVRDALSRAETASMVERDGGRWRMLEPVRQRMAEHLAEAGEAATARAALAAWAAAYFREADERLTLRHDAELLAAFRREEANLVEGVRIVLADGAADTAVVEGIASCYEPEGRRGDALLLLQPVRDALPLRAQAAVARLMALHLQERAASGVIDDVIERSIEAEDDAAAVEALTTRGAANLRGDLALAAADLARAAGLLAGIDAPPLEGRLLMARATNARARGVLDEAETWLEEAAALAEEHHLDGLADMVLAHRIPVTAARGEYEAGLALAGELLDRARATGSHARMGEAWNALGLLHTHRRELDEAERCFEEARAVWRAGRDPREIAAATLNLASNAYYRLDHELAIERAREAYAFAVARGALEGAADAATILAMNHRMLDNLAEARRYLASAIPAYRAMGNPFKLATALNTAADIAADDGDLDAALLAARESLDLYETVGHPQAAAAVRELVADLERRLATEGVHA